MPPRESLPTRRSTLRSPLLLALALLCASCGERSREPLRLFAAASLSEVAGDLARTFTQLSGLEVELNLAGSNQLARQIDAARVEGAFLSADRAWVEFLVRSGAAAGEPFAFASNRLVVVCSSEAPVRVAGAGDLVRASARFLALADPEAVPAGRYARSWLERSVLPDGGGTAWSRLERRVAPANDVRAALALVESSRDVVGIVYRTDAAASERVEVVFEVPASEHEPIEYWAVAVARGDSATPAARRFLEFLRTPAARERIAAHGFLLP